MELFLLSQSLASNPKASNLRTKVDYYPFSHLKKKKRFLDTFPQALLRGGQIGFFHYQVHQPTPAWRGWRCKRDFSQKVLVGRGAIDVFSCLLLGCFLTLSHSLSHTHTLSLSLSHTHTNSLTHTHTHIHTLSSSQENRALRKAFLEIGIIFPRSACFLQSLQRDIWVLAFREDWGKPDTLTSIKRRLGLYVKRDTDGCLS